MKNKKESMIEKIFMGRNFLKILGKICVNDRMIYLRFLADFKNVLQHNRRRALD